MADRSRFSIAAEQNCREMVGLAALDPPYIFARIEQLIGPVIERRVRLVPKAGGEPDRYVELEGPPDLIVEIISDASVCKDTERLPAAYYRAGVREFWLIDARGEQLSFQIHHRGAAAYEPAVPDAEGFQTSACTYRLLRHRKPQGRLMYDLEWRE